jgi:hypothetical protein
VTNKVFDIFEQERLGTFIADDSRNLEEQRTLSFVGKAVRAPKAVLFRYTGDGERLAREAFN